MTLDATTRVLQPGVDKPSPDFVLAQPQGGDPKTVLTEVGREAAAAAIARNQTPASQDPGPSILIRPSDNPIVAAALADARQRAQAELSPQEPEPVAEIVTGTGSRPATAREATDATIAAMREAIKMKGQPAEDTDELFNMTPQEFTRQYMARVTTKGEPINFETPGKKVHVIYLPDSIEAINAANMIRALGDVQDKLYSMMESPEGTRLEFSLHDARSAFIEEVPDAVIWLGLKPMDNIYSEPIRRDRNGRLSITVSERATFTEDEFSSLVFQNFREVLGEEELTNGALARNRDNPGTLQYGMLLAAAGHVYRMLGTKNEMRKLMLTRDFVDVLVAQQQIISRFNIQTADTRDVTTAFANTVIAMRNLDLPGGLLDVSEPAKAYRGLIPTVRSMVQRCGHMETIMVGRTPTRVWLTHINEYYWVARRHISFVYDNYLNVSLCRNGTMMYTNLESKHEIKIKDSIYRSH